jgi:hypothetical protein
MAASAEHGGGKTLGVVGGGKAVSSDMRSGIRVSDSIAINLLLRITH